jgi:hypothetical protein
MRIVTHLVDARPDQFQQHGEPLCTLAIGQVDEQRIGQILGHKGFQLAAQLVEAGSGHQPEGLLVAQIQGAGFTAAGLGRGDVIEEGAQLLAWIKDQQNPMLTELLGELLAEAAVELVGG